MPALEQKKKLAEFSKYRDMKLYSNIALLFSYPSGSYDVIVNDLTSETEIYGKEASDTFIPVAEHFTRSTLSDLQEYYIRTFDVNATCYLDIGYVLFGEESKRGQFLLNMKSEQLKVNNDCGTEFADHLPNVLTLMPLIEDALFREELAVTILIPALKIMIENFKTGENIYKNMLSILVNILETDYKNSAFVPFEIITKELDCLSNYSCGKENACTKK